MLNLHVVGWDVDVDVEVSEERKRRELRRWVAGCETLALGLLGFDYRFHD